MVQFGSAHYCMQAVMRRPDRLVLDRQGTKLAAVLHARAADAYIGTKQLSLAHRHLVRTPRRSADSVRHHLLVAVRLAAEC